MKFDPQTAVNQYRQSRYLRKASDEALQQRLEDIGNNLWSTGRDGEVIQQRDATHRRVVLELYTHVMLEQMERSKSDDMSFDELALRQKATANYVQRKTVRPITFEPDCYVKFGKREHILPALDGKLYIQPAAKYNDPSLNAAQLDNELQHHVRTPNQRLAMRIIARDENGKEFEVQPEWGEMFRYMEVPNFYVWCCGLGYDARLFSEFKADAALVIKDKPAFEKRFADAMGEQLPDAVIGHGPCVYYDPYTTQRDQLIPAFSKNIKYLYQNEYRFIWQFPDQRELQSFAVDLGPLHDIAEVVELAPVGT